MPIGYWTAVWTILWQATLANAAIATIAYWANVALNGNSFFIPFEALLMFAFFGVMGLAASSIILFAANFVSPEIARWAALAIWAAIYFGFSRSNGQEMRELHKALGSASALIYPLVAIAIWWRALGLHRAMA